jgi:hypothetical protein
MPAREALLDTAAFLDSPEALSIDGLDRAAVRTIAERFLACVYDDLQKAPRFLDGDDVHAILGHFLPARFGKGDPVARSVGKVLRAYFEFLEQRATISQGYEIRRSLEDNASLFLDIVEKGMIHRHGAAPTKPFVNKAGKVGRNDPCPCGSGKKFKQCCATLAG